eukprot:NODE_299_length_10456_cov_1.003669.p13 type:complete len:102 gc:universal NODE_299_length_10456_cov_1.003669:10406-10101(-)
MTAVTIDNGRACGISTMGAQIVCTDDVTSQKWKAIDSKKFQSIQLSGNRLCGISINGVLICGDANGQNWEFTNGKLKDFGLSGDDVFAINADNKGYVAHLQ